MEITLGTYLIVSVAGGPNSRQTAERNYYGFPLDQHDPYSPCHRVCDLYAMTLLTYSFTCCHCSTSQFSLSLLTALAKDCITTIFFFLL